MIKSVVREHHWSPQVVGDLFIDAEDHKGLEFWYNDLMDVDKQLKQLNKK